MRLPGRWLPYHMMLLNQPGIAGRSLPDDTAQLCQANNTVQQRLLTWVLTLEVNTKSTMEFCGCRAAIAAVPNAALR